MKIKLMEPVTGPNGEKFSDEAEVRHPRLGEWVMTADWRAVMKAYITDAFSIVLTHLPPATKVERIKVAINARHRYSADGIAVDIWQARSDFRGAVYIHPMSKSELVFSFTHPIYIRPEHRFLAEEFPWSTTRDEWHTVMLWPSFIEVER